MTPDADAKTRFVLIDAVGITESAKTLSGDTRRSSPSTALRAVPLPRCAGADEGGEAMPIEFHRDGPWELPEGWVWAQLGGIVDIHDGRRVPVNAKERENRIKVRSSQELFPYYGATRQVGVIDGFLFDGEYVLLGEDGAPFLETSRNKSYIASDRFWVITAHNLSARRLTINSYLMHYLNYADYTEFVGGTTRLKLTQADLMQIPIPVGPLAEQCRIVARIDELFSKIAEGEAVLLRARADLDTWRRAEVENSRLARSANPSSKPPSKAALSPKTHATSRPNGCSPV